MSSFHNFPTLTSWLDDVSEALPEKRLMEEDIVGGVHEELSIDELCFKPDIHLHN